MKLTIQYHTEKPAVELDVTETAPGLCIGPNPAYADCRQRPKFAVFHMTSATIIRAVKSMKAARELAGRLAPLLDWTRPAESLTWEELAPALKIAKEYAQ